VETGCRGGQGSPRAVAPNGRKEGIYAIFTYCFVALKITNIVTIRICVRHQKRYPTSGLAVVLSAYSNVCPDNIHHA
jgi:hypothetical protein